MAVPLLLDSLRMAGLLGWCSESYARQRTAKNGCPTEARLLHHYLMSTDAWVFSHSMRMVQAFPF